MSYAGQILRIPFSASGFDYNRNTDLLPVTALINPSSNINLHEGGLGKRGGTSLVLAGAITGTPRLYGLYHYIKRSGTTFLMFAAADGKLYRDAEANVLKTGMATSNYYSFALFDDNLFVADGSTRPQWWDGAAGATSNLTADATDWAGSPGYPIQVIFHARGTNQRLWWVTRNALYAGKLNDGKDAADANIQKMPVYTDTGLVGAVDFNGTIFGFSKTKAYIVDDSSATTTNWGYTEAIWDGGVANWRLITKAGNNLFLMNDELAIYSIQAVNSSGDYEQVNLTRPPHIDRWFREKATLSGIESFNASYDRTQRAINYFVQVGGSGNNTSVKYFIDRPPEIAWMIHDNQTYDSGYKASISAQYRTGPGQYTVYTGDYAGRIWKLEQSAKTDNSNAIKANFKTKELDMDNPRMWKHFKEARLRIRSTGTLNLTIRIWVDGVRRDDVILSISGTGAVFDSATFDSSTFATDTIVPRRFKIGHYGFTLQMEVVNETANEDFFISELLIDFKEEGVKPA